MHLAPYGTSWSSATCNTLIRLPILHLPISQRTPQRIFCTSNKSFSPTRTNWNDTCRSTNWNVTSGRTNRNDTLQNPHKTRGLWPSFDFWCDHHSPWGNTVLQRQVSAFISSNTFLWDSQKHIKFSSRNSSSLGYKGRYFFLKALRQLCKISLAQLDWVSNVVYWQVSKMF